MYSAVMPGFSSLSNHLAERKGRCAVVGVGCFLMEDRVFSRSLVRWRRARSSDSQSSMLMGWLVLAQEQSAHDFGWHRTVMVSIAI